MCKETVKIPTGNDDGITKNKNLGRRNIFGSQVLGKRKLQEKTAEEMHECCPVVFNILKVASTPSHKSDDHNVKNAVVIAASVCLNNRSQRMIADSWKLRKGNSKLPLKLEFDFTVPALRKCACINKASYLDASETDSKGFKLCFDNVDTQMRIQMRMTMMASMRYLNSYKSIRFLLEKKKIGFTMSRVLLVTNCL
eukprot:gene11591-12784_t